MPKRRRRYMEKFALGEVSFVRRGAQEGAEAVIMKSAEDIEEYLKTLTDEELEEIVKGGDLVRAMTSSDADHQHGISIHGDGADMYVMIHFAGGDSQSHHDHQVIMNADGSFTVSENNGHTHTIDAEEMRAAMINMIMKREFSAEERERLAESGEAMPDGGFPIVNTEDLSNAIQAFGRAGDKPATARHIQRRARALDATDMLPEEGELADLLKGGGSRRRRAEKEGRMTEEEIAKMQADLKTQTALAALNDAEKSHYNTLDEAGKTSFLGKSVEDRSAIVSKAAEDADAADPVVYKSADGMEFRQSDDPRLVQMAKDRDEDRKQLSKERALNEDARLTKMAENDFKHLPGDLDVRKDLIRAAESIEDDGRREEALKALKAQDARLAGAFKTIGADGAPVVKDSDAGAAAEADAELERLTKELMQKEGLDYTEAYDRIAKTNTELVAKALG